MPKNIVLCCDGTGNQVEGNLSNVLKLFRILDKTDRQHVYYSPGVGTIAHSDPWSQLKQDAKALFGLATGYGLDDEILGAYRFLCEHYEEGDAIFLFGFSRGAYSARALAGFIHLIGLLPPDQVNLADYALPAYKQASERNDLHIAWDFGRTTGCRHPTIRFVGVWDTVASVIVPRWDRLVPTLLTLPYTSKNPSVAIFRHAISIDERRRMFRLNRWKDDQLFVAHPFDKTSPAVPQDCKQVWFAGVHSDIGGGYPESESALSKYPLDWMINEAVQHGLQVNQTMIDHLVFGIQNAAGTKVYVAPSPVKPHDSMNWAWRLLEFFPKRMTYNEWPRRHLFGFYLPCEEPRMIANPAKTPTIHQSVLAVKANVAGYNPVNFPGAFNIEP